MTETKTTTTAPADNTVVATGAPRPKEELTQEDEINQARQEQADRQQELRDLAIAGDHQSLEGARPEVEPLPGEGPRPFPDGLVVGGPVLSPDERDRAARLNAKGRNPSGKGK